MGMDHHGQSILITRSTRCQAENTETQGNYKKL